MTFDSPEDGRCGLIQETHETFKRIGTKNEKKGKINVWLAATQGDLMTIHTHNSLEEAVAALDSGPMEARNEPHSYRRSIFRIEYGPIHVVWRRGGVVSDMTIKEARRLDTLDQMSIQRSLAAVCANRGIPVGPPREESDPTSDEIEFALRGIARATYQQTP